MTAEEKKLTHSDAASTMPLAHDRQLFSKSVILRGVLSIIHAALKGTIARFFFFHQDVQVTEC